LPLSSFARPSLSRRAFAVGVAAAGALVGCPNIVLAADALRVAFIPESGATPEQISSREPLVDYLQKATGRTIKLLVPTSYAATVEAIGNDGVDVAYFGGLTYVKARAKYDVKPLVQRAEDKTYHALFIASAANPNLKTLKELKGKKFAFGDVNSTSGHLIPDLEMTEAGLDTSKDISYVFTGNHPATAQAVQSGQADAGGIDEGIYKKLVADKTVDPAKARVFFTSRPFVDYVWAAKSDLDPATIAKVKSAFLDMKDAKLLATLRASKFVAADDREYDGIRATAKRLNLL
jgi:phosphonate transport system substrate-binding protein